MRRIFAFSVPLLIVLIIGALFYSVISPVGTDPGIIFQPNEGDGRDADQVTQGKDYYLLVSVVELSAKSPSGSEWDRNGTAPDVVAEIYWKGQRVYQSSVKQDTLVAKWSNAEFDLIEMAMKGKKTSVDGALQAARINIAPGDSISVKIKDKDLLGSADSAGEKTFATTDLKLGDTTYSFNTPGIRRIVLRVIDMNQPPDMFQ